MITSYGIRYHPPVRPWDGSTILAINVGGAVVPMLVSLYILVQQPGILGQAALATAIVALVVNRSARPIRGLGIATPLFIPPIVAALAGFILGGHSHAAPVAYIGGVLGTLIGADVANLGRLSDLGARSRRLAAPAPSTASSLPASSRSYWRRRALAAIKSNAIPGPAGRRCAVPRLTKSGR